MGKDRKIKMGIYGIKIQNIKIIGILAMKKEKK
jgi:hypothetical protein